MGERDQDTGDLAGMDESIDEDRHINAEFIEGLGYVDLDTGDFLGESMPQWMVDYISSNEGFFEDDPYGFWDDLIDLEEGDYDMD